MVVACAFTERVCVCSYLVQPSYSRTLHQVFQGYIDAAISAPTQEAAAALLPTEREVLLLLVQLCAALVHLRQHHVVLRDLTVRLEL